MRTRIRSSWLIACLGVLPMAAASAQEQVGVVARIAEKKGHYVDQTSRAELWRASALSAQVKRSAPIQYRDIVRLRDRVYLNLSFDQAAFKTEVYLGSNDVAGTGSYEILENAIGAVTGLQLVVKQGVMVVDHARGELLVVAAGIRTRIFGTRVLFVVDSAAQEATAYLSEGHLSFPDYAIDARGTNRVWKLKPGQAPQEVFAPASDPARWQREVNYSTESVWHATPFWQTPAFLVPAAAVVAGSVGCLATSCLGGAPSSRGGVVISIPP